MSPSPMMLERVGRQGPLPLLPERRRLLEADNHALTTDCKRCGQRQVSTLQMSPDCSMSEDCERRYSFYLPTTLCDIAAAEEDISSDNKTTFGHFPLVFTVHCFGCTMETFDFYQEIAEAYQFVWVTPEGFHRSFNGGQSCCGYAMEHNIDDVGFFQAIISQMEGKYPVSAKWVYAMGWSNGGYMVSFASHLFQAIAPISGYEVEPLFTSSSQTALFLHHSIDDPYVRITGCCQNSSLSKCCCKLSEQHAQCTHLGEQLDRVWSPRNGCSSTTTPNIISKSYEAKSNVTCYSYNDCKANTTYCLHQGKGHFNSPNFETAFSSMMLPVADFFANHFCRGINHPPAVWDSVLRQCRCSSSTFHSVGISNNPYLCDPTSHASPPTLHLETTDRTPQRVYQDPMEATKNPWKLQDEVTQYGVLSLLILGSVWMVTRRRYVPYPSKSRLPSISRTRMTTERGSVELSSMA